MRLILGMVLGATLLAAGTYYHDNIRTSTAPAPAANRAMVNWDVVEANWALFKIRLQDGWATLRARIDRA